MSAKKDAPRGPAQMSAFVKRSQNLPASMRSGLEANEFSENTPAPASELTIATATKYTPSAAAPGRLIAFQCSLPTGISLRQTEPARCRDLGRRASDQTRHAADREADRGD